MQYIPRGGSTVQTIWRIAEPIAQDLGLILWDIRFLKEGVSWFLRIFIDKDGGISLDDCEAFSRAIDPVLDEVDPIEQAYCLEVSSPGIERELTQPFHFKACSGEEVLVRLIRPRDGRREYTGRLAGLEDGSIVIEDANGESMRFVQKETALCRLIDDTFGGTI